MAKNYKTLVTLLQEEIRILCSLLSTCDNSLDLWNNALGRGRSRPPKSSSGSIKKLPFAKKVPNKQVVRRNDLVF